MTGTKARLQHSPKWHVVWYSVVGVIGIDLLYQILISWRQYNIIAKAQLGYLLFAMICQFGIYVVMVAPMQEFFASAKITLSGKRAFSLLAMGLALGRVIPLGDYLIWRTGLRKHRGGASATTQWYVMYYVWVFSGLVFVFLVAEGMTYILHPHATVHSLLGYLSFLPVTISLLVLVAILATRFRWVREKIKQIAFDKLGSQAISPMGIIRDRALSWNVLGIFSFASVTDWLLEGYTLYLCLRAVGINMPLSVAIFGFTFARLFSLIPVLPGGIGQLEAGTVLFFAAYGYGFGSVLTATVLYRLISYWPALLVGAVSYVLTARRDEAMAHLSLERPTFASHLHHKGG